MDAGFLYWPRFLWVCFYIRRIVRVVCTTFYFPWLFIAHDWIGWLFVGLGRAFYWICRVFILWQNLRKSEMCKTLGILQCCNSLFRRVVGYYKQSTNRYICGCWCSIYPLGASPCPIHRMHGWWSWQRCIQFLHKPNEDSDRNGFWKTCANKQTQRFIVYKTIAHDFYNAVDWDAEHWIDLMLGCRFFSFFFFIVHFPFCLNY